MSRGTPSGREMVLVTADQGVLAVAKSILESEAIPWFSVGEEALILSAYNAPLQFVELQVPTEHAARAKELLRHLTDENAQDA